jgi:hypothetical protein
MQSASSVEGPSHKRAAQRAKGLSRGKSRMLNPLYLKLRNHPHPQQSFCLAIELPRIPYVAERCFVTTISTVGMGGTPPHFKSTHNQNSQNSGQYKIGIVILDSYRSAQCHRCGRFFRKHDIQNCVPKANMGEPSLVIIDHLFHSH